MNLGAVVFLKIPYADLCKAHEIDPAASAADAIEAMATFIPIGAGAAACLLDVPYGSEPRELALDAWNVVGEVLEQHADPRGLFIAPDKNLKDAPWSSYDASIAHFGDAGQWVPKLSLDEASAAAQPSLDAMFGGGMASTMASLQSQIAADPRMAGELGAVAAGGAPSGDLLQMAQQMLSQMSPEQQAQLEQMAKAMFGGLDPSLLANAAPKQGAAHAAERPRDDDGDDPEFGSGDEPEPAKPPKK